MIPIYFINLSEREDRKKAFLNQFIGTGIKPIRVNAVNQSEVGNGHSVTEAVAACWLSHQATYLKFLESKFSHAVIMEDDALLSKESLQFIDNLQGIDLKDLDIFQFGYLTDRFRIDFPTYDPSPHNIFSLNKYIGVGLSRIDFFHRNWLRATRFLVRLAIPIYRFLKGLTTKKENLRKLENFYLGELSVRRKYGLRHPIIYHSIEPGAHAYVISRKCAKKLLLFNNPVFLPADLALMGIGRSKNFVVCRTSKSLCNQSGSITSISKRTLL